MNRLILSFVLLSAFAAFRAGADSWTNQYAEYGRLIVAHLDSAPFPHPARAAGHTYDKQFYSAEKNYSDNSVGIFVPKGFRRTEQVDFVVYFHSWRHHVENTLSVYHLIPQFVDSGRNAILVVPQGPYDAPDSFDGKLEDENRFKRFLDEVMATLQKNGVIRDEPIGSIILSGHSGGYQVVSSILARGGLSEHVREVYLFDALYARTANFMAWFDKYPGRRMINIYTEDGGTKKETEKLIAAIRERKPPVSFAAVKEADLVPGELKTNQLVFLYTTMEHDETPYGHKSFCEFLKTSCLHPIVLQTDER